MRELRVEDALMYLDQVKVEFSDRPHVYNEFLDIMKNFKSQQIDTPGVIERVSNLFHGNKKLVLGFNTFLPEGYKIELPMDGAPAVYRAPGRAGVTQININAATAAAAAAAAAAAQGRAPPPHSQQQHPPQQQAGHPQPPHGAHHQQQQQQQQQPGVGQKATPQQQQQLQQQQRGQHQQHVPSPRGPHPQQHPPPHIQQQQQHPGMQQAGPGPSPQQQGQRGPPPSWAMQAQQQQQRPGGGQHEPPQGAPPPHHQQQQPQQPEVAATSARQRLAAAEQQGRALAEQAQLQQHAARAASQMGQPGQRINVPSTGAGRGGGAGGGPGGPPPLPGLGQPPPHGVSPAQQQAQQAQQQAAQQGGPPPPGGGQQPAGQPVEFDHAINYVTTIKKRFANKPDTYKNFLKILHTYQKEQRGIKEVLDEVSELFADHPDLLQEFTYFLPDAVQAQAKAQLQEVARIAEERKRRMAAEAAASVAEARSQAIMRAKIAAREQKQQQRQRQAVAQQEESSRQQQQMEAAAAAAAGGQQQSAAVPDGMVGVVPSSSSTTSSSARPPAGMPYAPPPPPVPFGATRGRTEEREREICRSAIYGLVSFAPVRPPRKGELSPAQAAAKYGRPRSIPEPPMQPSAREAAFFVHAREHLNRRELAPDKPAGSRRHTPYAEFLKCLHLFGAGILSREEILLLLRTLFMQGHAPKSGVNAGGAASNPKVAAEANDLMSEFEAILVGRGPYANQQNVAKDKSKYGSLPMRLCDFSRSEHPTPSYWTYPPDHPHKRFSHSGQSPEDAAVLNNELVCVGDDVSGGRKGPSIESYDGPKMRRNVYEEAMCKVEDERFEMDMAIERNFSAMRQVEPLAEEVSILKAGEERDGQPIGRMQYNLRQRSLGPNHIGAIARLYADAGDEVVRHLAKNPVAVLPIVYKRLKDKDAEWRAVRTEWNKKWKVEVQENAEGSLDVLCYFRKREVERSFSLDNLLEECKRAKHFLKEDNKVQVPKSVIPIAPSFCADNPNLGAIFFQPYIKVSASDSMPHRDAHFCLSTQVAKICKSKVDLERVSRIWAEFMVPLFSMPSCWFTEELRKRMLPDECTTTVKYAVGQMVRTAFGDGEVTSVIDGNQSTAMKYRVKLPYGCAFLRPNAIIHGIISQTSTVLFARNNGKMERVDAQNETGKVNIVDPEYQDLFGTEKIYLFLRLYCILISTLSEAREALTAKSPHGAGSALPHGTGKAGVPGAKEGADSYKPKKRGSFGAKRSNDARKPKCAGYPSLVAALQDYVKGRLNSKAFETRCRSLCKGIDFRLAALPRLLEKCADALVKVAREDVCLKLFDRSQFPQMDILQLRSECLNITNEATFRVQYDSKSKMMSFCYLPPQATLLVAPKSSSLSSGDGATAVISKNNEMDTEENEEVDAAEKEVEAPSSKRLKLK